GGPGVVTRLAGDGRRARHARPRTVRGARVWQPRGGRAGLRFGPGPGVPLRRTVRDAVGWGPATGGAALVRAPGAEAGGPAGHAVGCRQPLRGGCAPAARWRHRAAGVLVGQLP